MSLADVGFIATRSTTSREEVVVSERLADDVEVVLLGSLSMTETLNRGA